MSYEMDCDLYNDAQEVLSGQYDTTREPIETAFWNGDYAAEFVEWCDASDLAYLTILLIRTPWEDLQDVISAQAENEYRAVEEAIETFIDNETRKMCGWDYQ